jgi:TonB family protein
MKQTFCAALLWVVLPVLAMAQDGPAIQLKGSIVCRGNGNDVVGCVMPPQQTRAPEPMYPEKERKARHQGVVTLEVVVGSDGATRDISVLSTLGPDFDKAAIDAVKQWKFSPAMKDGKPVAVKIAVEVGFHLTH